MTLQDLDRKADDSLIAVELRNGIQSQLKVVVTFDQLLRDPSITQLASAIHQRLSEDEDDAVALEPAQRDEPSADQATAGETLAHLDELSDAEVEEMLRTMTQNEEE